MLQQLRLLLSPSTLAVFVSCAVQFFRLLPRCPMTVRGPVRSTLALSLLPEPTKPPPAHRRSRNPHDIFVVKSQATRSLRAYLEAVTGTTPFTPANAALYRVHRDYFGAPNNQTGCLTGLKSVICPWEPHTQLLNKRFVPHGWPYWQKTKAITGIALYPRATTPSYDKVGLAREVIYDT